MLRIIIKGLKRQVNMVASQQFVPKIVLSQEQQCFQVKGIQSIDASNTKPQ
jgi:hypothetical protein